MRYGRYCGSRLRRLRGTLIKWRNELVARTEKGKDGEPVMVLMPRVTIVDADKISDEAAAAVAEVSQTGTERCA
jgi:hypothetical protein